MNNPILQEKLKRLREYYGDPDSIKFLSDTEKEIRQQIAQSGLKNMEVVQKIIQEAQNKINGINALLQFDEELTDEKRRALFKERSVHQFYLERFDSEAGEKKLESLEKFLDDKLKEIE